MFQIFLKVRFNAFLGLFFGAAFSLANFSPAQAVPITFAYEGTINRVTFPAFQSFIGETIRVDYTFESTTPNFATDMDVGIFKNGI